MKRAISLLLAALLLMILSACRIRIDADADRTEYETVYQPNPVQMAEAPERVFGGEADPDEVRPSYSGDGTPVDETTPAHGGELTQSAPDTPELGQAVTVTLDAMGGECEKKTVTVRSGGVYGSLPTPTKSGMTFQGWFRSPEGGEPIREISVVLAQADHSLYAHWTVKAEFLLTFDPNGGRISPYSAQKTVYFGEIYADLPTPIRDGYTFLGWYTEPIGGEALKSTDIVSLLDDTTVYAHWEYNPYAYWSFVLENTSQRIFTCQETSAYLETAAIGTTIPECPLLSDAGLRNVAQYESSPFTTDAWVLEKSPRVIVKLADNMGAAEATLSAVSSRFPNARVLVFPTQAVYGTSAEQLYYKLCLAALIYPTYYTLDFSTVAAELGVAPMQIVQ